MLACAINIIICNGLYANHDSCKIMDSAQTHLHTDICACVCLHVENTFIENSMIFLKELIFSNKSINGTT